ncbi:MAG: T9SS type A sorting domain-containing protein [Fibrobacteres bacterium]|nr:T9SS type A sorting domain-containing protein [Fibrobacterota bacterium]
MVKCLIIVFVLVNIVAGQSLFFSTVPANKQFYPRGNSEMPDSAEIKINGEISNNTFDTMSVIVKKNGQFFKRRTWSLNKITNSLFHLSVNVHAELAEYRFEIYGDTTLLVTRDSIVCGDVYVVNGQSNALCRAASSYKSEWIRTFGTSSGISQYCISDTTWDYAQAATQETHASVGVWPLRLARNIVEKDSIPVFVINGAVGGTTIKDHMRNQSAPQSTGTIYGRLLYRLQKAGLKNCVKAFYWHQGENNSDSTALIYADKYDTLYKNWKVDYPGISKFYLCQIHHGCGFDYQSYLRDVQRRMADKYSDLSVMSTIGLPGHDGCHYNETGYNQLGDNLYRLAAKDFYGSKDTVGITAPAIKEVKYRNSNKSEIGLVFDQPVLWPADLAGQSLKNYIYLDGVAGQIDSGRVFGNEVVLYLKNSSNAAKLTYLPNANYTNGSVYQGPYLLNSRGVAALTFDGVTISQFTNTENSVTAKLNIAKTFIPVALYSISGRRVAELDKNMSLQDINKLNIPAGVYYLKYRTDKSYQVRCLVKL